MRLEKEPGFARLSTYFDMFGYIIVIIVNAVPINPINKLSLEISLSRSPFFLFEE